MNRRITGILIASIALAVLIWNVGIKSAEAQRGFSGQRGVTLYSDADFGGNSETITGDVAELSRTRIGNDRLSSLRVDRGCRAILYSDSGFRGRSMEVTYDIPSLNGTAVGNDSVSSIRVECGQRFGNNPPAARQPIRQSGGPDYSGVTIFWRTDFHGRSHFFHEDHPNLGQTAFGNNQASSIILDSGCQVTLYAAINFQGRSVTLNANERHLSRTSVGDNAVNSLRVNCRR